jgi:uncharacterized protein
MIWLRISKLILKNRPIWLSSLFILTVIMGYFALKVQLAYELPKILPKSSPNFQLYESFKQRYGEDGNVMILGIESEKVFEKETFNKWMDLNKDIKAVEGIKNVLSISNLSEIVKDEASKSFKVKPLLATKPNTQAEVDSLKSKVNRLPFYKGFILSEDQRSHLMAVTFDQSKLNTKGRQAIVRDIESKGLAFEKNTGIDVHFSGMPFIRTNFSSKVSREMGIFLLLAFGVTILILILLFKNWQAVLFPSIVVVASVAFSVGVIFLLGYKITILTGLIPPIIIVISIPNSIFFINKYQEEFLKHGDKIRALSMSIEKIGNTTFLANVTTSIGFFVFYFTNSPLLLEFGLVAAICIMATWAFSLIIVPILYSYASPPKSKHTKHLENKYINQFLAFVERIVQTRRTKLYIFIIGLMAVSTFGMLMIKVNGYVVDDLPEKDPIFRDLKWIEKNFHGVVPLEVAIDTRKPDGVFSPQILTKIKLVQKEFAKHPEFTKPVSVVEGIKFVYQAYRDGDPKYYQLPGALELKNLAEYAGTMKGNSSVFSSFVDSTRQYTRVSFQMADIGTAKVNKLTALLQPKIDSIFNYDAETGQMLAKDQQVDARITGNGFVFTQGNNYLLQNLQESTLLAIFLVCIVMALLFMRLKQLSYTFRMILIASIPSVIPLIITAGIMGFFHIDLKPSTILIFSIAFGISSDGTIYFLTKYKDEMENYGHSVRDAVSNTIRQTGISMFYTGIILFAGFFIFTASSFKGTIYLGLLVSITLLMGMISNLVMLPALLLTLDKKGKI